MDELAALQKEQKRGARTYIGKMSESELRKKLTHKVEGVPLKEVSWRFQVSRKSSRKKKEKKSSQLSRG